MCVCVLLCDSTINLPEEEAYVFENGQKLINLEHFNCLVSSETSVSEMEIEWEKEGENEKKDDVKKTVNFSVNKLLSHLQAHHSHSSRGVLQISPISFKSVRVFDTFFYTFPQLIGIKKKKRPATKNKLFGTSSFFISFRSVQCNLLSRAVINFYYSF